MAAFPQSPPPLSPHDLRRVGVAAGCDPRTVKSYIAGKPTHSTTANRLKEALVSVGFGHLVPKATGA